jgi:hypothetical protein
VEAKKKLTECWNCGESGHWAKECPKAQRNKIQTSSTATTTTKSPRAYMASVGAQDVDASGDSWIADSGCIDHMTDKRLWFTSYQDISMQKRHIEGIGGMNLLVYGIGDIGICTYNRKK